MRSLVHHDDEVGDGGAVDRATGAGAHDDGNLRNDATGTDVAEENLSVGAERGHAFLDASAARIVHADDGPPGFEGHVEHFANL